MASRYDDELWELVPDDGAPAPAAIALFVRALDPVERALDLGCGDGRVATELRAAEVTLADVSAVALARAARRVPGAPVAELTPDAPLPFPDTTFDLVLCAETLEHVRDVQLLLSEARRVLRPGAALAVTTPAHGRASSVEVAIRGFERRFDPFSPHLRFFTRRSLRDGLEATGFEVRSLRRRSGTLFAVATR
jgi:SAM-dependent methyltransferase